MHLHGVNGDFLVVFPCLAAAHDADDVHSNDGHEIYYCFAVAAAEPSQ